MEANLHEWRVKRETRDQTDPLEVTVEVYRADDLVHPIVKLVTLVEDL